MLLLDGMRRADCDRVREEQDFNRNKENLSYPYLLNKSRTNSEREETISWRDATLKMKGKHVVKQTYLHFERPNYPIFAFDAL